MEKIKNVYNELIKIFEKRFKINTNDNFEILKKSSNVIYAYLKDSEKNIGLIIIEKISEIKLESLLIEIDTVYSNDKYQKGEIQYFILSPEIPDLTIREMLHENSFFTFFDNVINRLCILVADYYRLYITGKNIGYTLTTIIEEYEEKMATFEEHIAISASSYVGFRYWMNEVYPILPEQDLKYLFWEKNVIVAKLKPEFEKRYDSDEFKGKTFKPTISYLDEKGQKTIYPDILQLKQEDGIEQYFYSRYQNTKSILLKFRYLELLLFWNSSLIKKIDCIKELDLLLIEIISKYKMHKKKITHLFYAQEPYLERLLEIHAKYFDMFDQKEMNDFKVYYLRYIQQLDENMEYRWFLDSIEIILNAEKIVSLFNSEAGYFISLIQKGIKQFEEEKNTPITISFYELYERVQKIFVDKNQIDFNLRKANAFIDEAKEKMVDKNFLAAIFFFNGARSYFLSNEKRYKKEIAEIDKLSKQCHSEQVHQMKKTEIEVDISYKKKQSDDIIYQYKQISKEDVLKNFFSKSDFLISTKSFSDSLAQRNTGLDSILTSPILLDNNRTVFMPTNEAEKEELQHWLWYGNISQIWLRWIPYIFEKLIDGQIVSVSDIIEYITKNPNISDDDKSFLQEGLRTYESGFYSSSISLLISMVEKFFRKFQEKDGDDLHYTNNKSYYNISLDQMIKDSTRYGIPDNVILFARYFFSQERGGYNLRNFLSHGLVPYNILDSKELNQIVIWFLCLCYLNFH